MYIYHHEEDESTFQLVDSSRPQRTLHHKPRGRQMQVNLKRARAWEGIFTFRPFHFFQSKIRRDRERREERKLGGRQQVPFKKNREK